jgi:signal transduction histidine kinase
LKFLQPVCEESVMFTSEISLPVPHTQPERIYGPRLTGGWRIAGIGAWAIIWLISLGTFVLATRFWFTWDSTPFIKYFAQHPNEGWPNIFLIEYQEAIRQMGMSLLSYALLFVVLRTLACIPYLVISALIMRRYSNRLMAVLFAVILAVVGVLGRWGMPNWQPLPFVYPWTNIPVLLLGFIGNCGVIIFYIFPDGRFVPRWTRWMALFVVLLYVVSTFPPLAPLNPYRVPWLGRWIDPFLYVSGLLAIIYRYLRRADSVQRQQMKWIISGAAFLVIFYLTFYILGLIPWWWKVVNYTVKAHLVTELVYEPGWYVGEVLLAVGFGISLFRYRLWEINLVINRVLVYGSLTLLTMGIYIGTVVGLGSLFRDVTSPLVFFMATGLIAILFEPMRRRLQNAVNRLMYGERDDPYRVLTRLANSLEHSATPNEVLPTIAETVRQALKIPYVAIQIQENGEDHQVAMVGQVQEDALIFPLFYQAELIGALQVGRRAPGEGFSKADIRLLENIARQAGSAAETVRLNAELVRSRAEIVTTREEERRRLRRDLHDGLGPILASQTLKMAAVRQLVRQNPERAETMLDDIIQQNEGTVSEIRRLVYGLRPPALDELGLVEAVHDLVHRSEPDDNSITVEGPDEGLPKLPAAVEANAYRIALEGLTNATRYSKAQHCIIRFTIEDKQHFGEAKRALVVQISDDGIGMPKQYRAGVGIRSMRERAEELGGQLIITAVNPHGTHISAWLPLVECD